MIKEIGTIFSMGEVVSGRTRNGGTWARQEIILEVQTSNNSFKRVVLRGDTDIVSELSAFNPGDEVEVTYGVSAREWQGKWYNNVDIYRIEAVEKETDPAPAPAPAEETGDLPF